MRKEDYMKRLVDADVEKFLSIFGAVCIEGPKWCGKTWTSLTHSESVVYIGDSESDFQNRELAQLNPKLVLSGNTPRLIDEWQEVPSLWDAVRAEVDLRNKKGQFILTGSSTPNKKGVLHSGIGRIHTIRMRTMSLYESGESSGKVSLKLLFDNDITDTVSSPLGIEELIFLIVRGGWPASLDIPREHAREIPKSYVKGLIENDIHKIDDVNRDRVKVEALLKSLARNESTLASNRAILRDMNKYEEENIEMSTLQEYMSALERLFVIEPQNAFSPNYRSSIRVAKTPKRHFTDPSLAVAALGLSKEMLLGDLNFLGFLFEGLVIRDLEIYAESIGAKVYHYKNHQNSDELDAVVEHEDGRWIAIEIKLGANQIDKAAEELLKINNYFIQRENLIAPSALVIICGLTKASYRRADGVLVVSITDLSV